MTEKVDKDKERKERQASDNENRTEKPHKEKGRAAKKTEYLS